MNIYRFQTGPLGVNTYLVFDDDKSAFMVDPGGFSQHIVDTISENDLELSYIILTHGHSDHIGGVDAFRKVYPNATVIAHEQEKEILSDPNKNCSRMMNQGGITLEADQYVAEGDTLDIGKMHLAFLHTPGHTPGGMSFTLENYVFSGDTLFQLSVGRTDFPGGDFDTLISSIKNKLFTLPDDTIVLPGHMDPTQIGIEKERNPFV